MGVRHEMDIIETIHPPINPWKHLWPASDESGNLVYKLVPGLSGMRIAFGELRRRRTTTVQDLPQLGDIEFDFLPRVFEDVPLPPAPLSAREVVQKTMNDWRHQIFLAISSLPPNVDVITSSHGNMWGKFPEQIIADWLTEMGFKVDKGSFPQTGGRKRIMEHGIFFQR